MPTANVVEDGLELEQGLVVAEVGGLNVGYQVKVVLVGHSHFALVDQKHVGTPVVRLLGCLVRMEVETLKV